MKLVTFQHATHTSVGVIIGEEFVLDVNIAYANWQTGDSCDSDMPFVPDMKSLLTRGAEGLAIVSEFVEVSQSAIRSHNSEALPQGLIPVKNVRLLAPVPNPQKIVAIGQNYRDHCAEQGVEPPDHPIIFAKFPTSIIGPYESITWDPELTSEVDYEAELAVVIGQKARNVAEEDAFDFVAGYMNANDVSARDLQFGDRQWVRGKSLDTFCPTGPYLVIKDEIADPHALAIRAILNDTVMQDSDTSNLIFSVPYLIAYASRAFTLLPGDILLTGTPPGVGVFRNPKVLLKPGDTITIEVEHLGSLTNIVN